MRDVLTVLAVLGVLVVLFIAAAVATRDGDVLLDAPPDGADLDLPTGPLQPEDVRMVRFGMALRGYRMAEVDAVLDRLAAELAERDAELLTFRQPVAPPVTEAPVEDSPAEALPTSGQQPVVSPTSQAQGGWPLGHPGEGAAWQRSPGAEPPAG